MKWLLRFFISFGIRKTIKNTNTNTNVTGNAPEIAFTSRLFFIINSIPLMLTFPLSFHFYFDWNVWFDLLFNSFKVVIHWYVYVHFLEVFDPTNYITKIILVNWNKMELCMGFWYKRCQTLNGQKKKRGSKTIIARVGRYNVSRYGYRLEWLHVAASPVKHTVTSPQIPDFVYLKHIYRVMNFFFRLHRDRKIKREWNQKLNWYN